MIENHFRHVKRDLSRRINSIKSHLDSLNGQFEGILDSLKEETLSQFNKVGQELTEERQKYQKFYDTSLAVLKQQSNDNNNKLINNIHELKDYDIKFCEYTDKFKSILNKYEFEPHDWMPELSQLGLLRRSVNKYSIFDKVLVKTIEQCEIGSMCILNNEIFASKNKESRILSVYDKNFKHLRDCNLFVDNVYRFSSNISLCSDRVGNVFICDTAEGKVYVMGKHLNKVTKTIGSSGKNIGQFCLPNAICYLNGQLFVLDTENQRIQIFSSKGLFKKEIALFKFDSNELIENCKIFAVNEHYITVANNHGVYTFDMNGNSKGFIDQENIMSMCLKDNYLFIHSNQGFLGCYEINVNDYGDYGIQIVSTYFNDNLKYDSGSMIFDENNIFFLSFPQQKRVITVEILI